MGYVETASRASRNSTGTQSARLTQRESPWVPEKSDSFERRAPVDTQSESDKEESSFFSMVLVALFVLMFLGVVALLDRLRPRQGERTGG